MWHEGPSLIFGPHSLPCPLSFLSHPPAPAAAHGNGRLLFKAGMRVLRALWKESYRYIKEMRASWKACGGVVLLERAVGLHQRVPAMAEEVQSVLSLVG